MFGSKASGRRSVQVFRLLSNLFVARPGLVKKIQRVLDLHQQTFDLLPLVGPRTFIELFEELLLLREELCDGGGSDDPLEPCVADISICSKRQQLVCAACVPR